MSSKLTHQAFEGIVGEIVRLSSPDHEELRLEIVEATKAPGDRPDESFSVLFKGPADVLLPQKIYQLDLGSLGDHSLFIVPIAEESDGYVYESVFSTIEEPGGP